jgi:hypothetical protein
MRCLSCDKRLNDRESVRKYSSSGTFVDLCDRCFATVSDDIPDIEEGSGGSSEFIEDESDGTERDYQQYLGGSCDDC